MSDPIRPVRCSRRPSRLARVPLVGLALLAPLSLTVPLPSDAAAGPSPVGPEYPVENRPLPPKSWWTMCSQTGGVTTTIVASCSDPHCEEPGDLLLERTDASGRVTNARAVNEAPAGMFAFRVACHPSGRLVAQWQDSASGCFLHRVFDATGAPVSTPVQTVASQDCRVRASLAVRADGQFTAAWPVAQLDGGSKILARRFGADGRPLAAAVTVSDADVVRRYRPKIATDDDGITLISWSNYAEAPKPAALLGHFLDATGRPLGATFQINTFEAGDNAEPALLVRGSGVFEVVWSNPYQGGRVARLVSVHGEDAEVPATPTTTTTLPHGGDDLPRFGRGRIVDSLPSDWFDIRPRRLASGSPGTWLLAQRSTEYWHTADDGVKWHGPLTPATDVFLDTVVGTDGAGTWGAAHVPWAQNRVYFSRSADDARSWSEAQALPEGGHISERCANCAVIRTDVLGAASGTWVTAWTFHDYTTDARGARDEDIERIYVLRSKDGARSWSSPLKIAVDQGVGRWGFDLGTDGAGTWIAMWIDGDIRFARSTDDARTWSAPKTIASGVSCPKCGSQERYATVQLAHDGSGAWAAVFASASYLPSVYGHDGDVFVLRSGDDGATWSGPAPVDPSADRDATRDFDPTIAADSTGLLAAWASHQPLAGGDDLDADLVVAKASRAHDGWSAPRAAGPRANERAMHEAPLLAADERGELLLAWQKLSADGAADGYPIYTIRAAMADATCGDGATQTGEACDDANSRDGDGCDSNCTLTGCGNAIVTEGEECDFAASREAYGCVDCRLPVCGDGVVSGAEECDDGNSASDDECTDCRIARCGDGVVQKGEACDDPYGGACTSECKVARCGDGKIRPGIEACDDGNDVDDDACPNDCSKATCGDGYTSRGFEECDYNDAAYAGACTPDCILPGVCGDANGDNSVTARDAHLILRDAVGLDVGCPRVACDMDDSGAVTVSDAKMDLHKAVGLWVGDRCSIGTGNIVFWIDDDTNRVGALQLEIEYGQTGGSFAGSADQVACETLLPVLASFNDVDAARTLNVGVIALQGFWGHVDVFRCKFEMPEDRAGVRFFVRYIDAADVDLSPITPPQIGYRLE